MPRVYVEFARMKQLAGTSKTVSGKIDGVRSNFKHTINQLDWDVKYQSNINNTANQLAAKLDRYVQALKGYQTFLDYAHSEYVKLDNEKFDGKLVDISGIIGNSLAQPANETKPWWENTLVGKCL